jgi:thiamine pyrophosphate-dependent acetolactate synthase large subunit-like protein
VTTREAIGILARQLREECVVATTGYISRDLQASAERPGNFYMIGSMGLAASLGMGIALVRPDRKIVVFDGDGSALMGLGGLATLGSARPANLVHVVFDNEVFASTGSQPTCSDRVPLDEVAVACGYPVTRRVSSPAALEAVWRELASQSGPIFLLVKCRPNAGSPTERIRLGPEEMTTRFMEGLNGAFTS